MELYVGKAVLVNEQTEGQVGQKSWNSAGSHKTTALSLQNFGSDKEQAHRKNIILQTETSQGT